MAARLAQPIGKAALTLHQHFGDVLHHLQAMGLDHTPEQVMRSQAVEAIIESAQRTHRITFEGQHPADIGQATHQIEVEVRLENRLRRREVVIGAFIGVQAQAVGTQSHTLGHDHQGMLMHTVASTQQKEPVSLVVIVQPQVELGKIATRADQVLRL
ncbi:hypothetical protein D3C77_502280 [compost metagenome]